MESKTGLMGDQVIIFLGFKTKKIVLFRQIFYFYQYGTENKDNKKKLVGFFKNKENQENKKVWAACKYFESNCS